ncbi:Uncharacterised protein [Nocardia otitidiscaviarum]|uniref:ParB/Sulfiredoxin domain-containing protein n=1 Tax=Nocardia otitidiscaviarum TaxID=1823 RepID=A0A379JLQ2_9NOCA|nr:hypothetical protein [Nocardia otitidiscaviarum]SUD49537.1 Uncharacterised protein [Nocardia otitidiscaviarum]
MTTIERATDTVDQAPATAQAQAPTTPTPIAEADRHPVGSLAKVDPNSVALEKNRRQRVDNKLIGAVRASGGNLFAAHGYYDSEGVLTIRHGQHRTLACRAAGVELKVEIIAADLSGSVAAEADRISEQFSTNHDQYAADDTDVMDAVTEMMDLGFSANQAGAKLRIGRKRAAAARDVAKSATARAAVDASQLSLTEALVLAEFEGDEEAEAELLQAAAEGQFAHVAQQLREDRDARAERARLCAELTDAGYTILTECPRYDSYEQVSLHFLRRPDGRIANGEDVKTPEHWGVWLAVGEVKTENASGEVEVRTGWKPEYFCLAPAAEGLSVVGGDAAAREEKKRVQRERSTRCNAAARAATVVRREFVATLVKGSKLPPKADKLTAAALTRDPALLTEYRGRAIAAELLGFTTDKLAEAVEKASEARARVIAFALLLGGFEARMQPTDATPNYWRVGDPDKTHGYARLEIAALYLRFLRERDYGLADIERVTIGEASTADIRA